MAQNAPPPALGDDSGSERDPPPFIHNRRFSTVLDIAADQLVPEHDVRPMAKIDRALGTLSRHGLLHTSTENELRAAHIRATAISPTQRDVNSTRPMMWIAASAAAMHRALEKEWADADVITHSVALRAPDVNGDDAQAAADFFAVTDAFVRAYYRASDFVLGGTGIEERAAVRESAIEALDRFAQAREAFLASQNVERTKTFLLQAEAAKSATLAVTKAEASGIGELKYASISDVAAEMSAARGGPLLVQMLARGVVGTPRKKAAWTKHILFPRRFRAPRPFCICRLTRCLDDIHGAYVRIFRDAEREYRDLFQNHAPGCAASRDGDDGVYAARVTVESAGLAQA